MSSIHAEQPAGPVRFVAPGGYPFRDPYRVRFTPRYGWTREITVLDDHRLFRLLPQFDRAVWDKPRHVHEAYAAGRLAAAIGETINAVLREGARTYGEGGALISGGFRDHWPEAWKDTIRLLHTERNYHHDRSLAHWRAAGRTVATWRAHRDAWIVDHGGQLVRLSTADVGTRPPSFV